jgi:hypothetical protein
MSVYWVSLYKYYFTESDQRHPQTSDRGKYSHLPTLQAQRNFYCPAFCNETSSGPQCSLHLLKTIHLLNLTESLSESFRVTLRLAVYRLGAESLETHVQNFFLIWTHAVIVLINILSVICNCCLPSHFTVSESRLLNSGIYILTKCLKAGIEEWFSKYRNVRICMTTASCFLGNK